MAFTPEELEQLGQVIDAKVQAATADVVKAAEPQPQANDEAQNQPENQPDYWVHLADGSVFKSKDSQSTHMLSPTSGISEAVIGHFPAGAE